MKMRFTDMQPKDGDRIAHCGHLEDRPHYFFKTDGLVLTRPDDGTQVEPQWLVLCRNCFPLNRNNPAFCIHDDGTWIGDAPAVKEVVQ